MKLRPITALTRRSLAICAALSATACGPQIAQQPLRPPEVPSLRVDIDASEVEVENAENAEEVRQWATDAVNAMTAIGEGSVRTARIRARIKGDYTSQAYLIPFVIVTLPIMGHMWFPAATLTAEVELTVEVDGKRFSGLGRDQQGIKFMAMGSDAYWQAAVHNATQDAVKNARLVEAGEP